MIRAILFDMGGTLDGDGLHWLERFLELYRNYGIELSREMIRQAFDEAERQAGVDEQIATAGLRRMIASHVRWQLSHLKITDPQLEQHLIRGFIEPVGKTTEANVRLLGNLAERGFVLGVVSNGCGNVDQLCADFGYTRFLSVVVDSRRAGVSKPDPAIYRYAADKLRLQPGEIMMVGDSFERDIRPAKAIGMKTAWLHGSSTADCPDPIVPDICLARLADLPDALAAFTLALA